MEEEEDLYLDSPAFSKELVENVRKCWSEYELLTWLAENKPGELRLGREHWLEMKELEDFKEGLCLKLSIHGYEDRADRLKYLWEVLKKKWGNKENAFKIVTRFLMNMAVRPTGVISLDLNDEKYSSELEEDEPSIDEDSEKQKALLLDILGDTHDETERYSSGDSLSSWTDSEDEDVSAKSGNSLPDGIKPIRTSSSFGEFSDLVEEKKQEDPEKKKYEAQIYWQHQKIKADESLKSTVRRFETVPLKSQPVISSLVVLHARFGEYWEWKHQKKDQLQQSDTLQVAFVEDVVRELIWQFVISNSSSSPVFTPDWKPRPNLMVASMSESLLVNLLTKFGETFEKLEILRKFSSSIQTSARFGDKPPSKAYLMYSSALDEISTYILHQIDHIERELKRLPRPYPDPSPTPACTTFIQLIRQTRDISDIIDLVYKVHSHSVTVSDPGAGDFADQPWQSSIRLLSSVEAHLSLESRPTKHGVLLFLYSKLFQCLLQEILDCLKTLQWNEQYSLFTRDSTVLLNDLNFWSDCIKIRTISTFPKGELLALRNFLPKVLNILKTCELFNQLEENFSQILDGEGSKISVESLIRQFLKESLPFLEAPPAPENSSEESIDYMKHFAALGLASSLAVNCFRFLTEPRQKRAPKTEIQSPSFPEFLKLPAIPIRSHGHILDSILTSHFTPFCSSAKLQIEKIFQDYKVLERLTIFQEIILAVREDFARGIILIASKQTSSEYKFEDVFARNSKFQQLLNNCYPPELRGDIFSIDLRLDPSSDMNCTFDVAAKFPLNLIVTPQSVAGYLFIGRQLHRIRKSLWNVNSLSMKSCCSQLSVATPADKYRLLAFRFCLINFCSSLRSFFMLKVFSTDFSQFISNNAGGSGEIESDLDLMRRVHENYLDMIQTKMLREPLIENILIRKMTTMSESLRLQWKSGVPQRNMMMLEDTLKKCWQVVNSFESTSKYSPDFNQLSWHFSRPPCYLTNS